MTDAAYKAGYNQIDWRPLPPVDKPILQRVARSGLPCPMVIRDTIGGDRIDYGSDNRLSSPGPYRDTGNTGQRCTGVGCQALPLPEPENEEGEG